MAPSKKKSSKKMATNVSIDAVAASDLSTTSLNWNDRPETPPNGWAEELQEASQAAKKDPSSSAKQLRVATASRVLRQWKRCKQAAQCGLSTVCVSSTQENKQKLTECLTAAETELKKPKSLVDSRMMQDFPPKMFNQEVDIDLCQIPSSPSFKNTNYLQYAAVFGDARLLEAVIALGAGLDCPVLVKYQSNHEGEIAPQGWTALLIACMFLVGQTKNTSAQQVKALKHDGRIDWQECAVVLVMLGADFNKRLVRPSGSRKSAGRFLDTTQALGLFGKSVKELALQAGAKELLDAIERMEENAIKHVWCRCGSRLPWGECHAAPVPGQDPYYIIDSEENGALYRYSPLAPCPCFFSKKLYYDCCWFSTCPRYLDDVLGVPMKNIKVPGAIGAAMVELSRQERLKARSQGTRGLEGTPAPEHFSSVEDYDAFRAQTILMVKTMGPANLFQMAGAHDKTKSRLHDWDRDVYAGCLERLSGKFFPWTDIHWRLSKTQVLNQVALWNEALEAYCDDKRLTGLRRERVVRQHTASPLAPCGNPSCDKWETGVKEFQQCSSCKLIAYCSRGCQKKHWKGHKQSCIKM
jgi:hypothetical protein